MLAALEAVPLKSMRKFATRSRDRKSTRLNSSHLGISYAVFCLKKKKNNQDQRRKRPLHRCDHQQRAVQEVRPHALHDKRRSMRIRSVLRYIIFTSDLSRSLVYG